ncbi:MAG: hypothetical protein D6678_00470 [Zetaproteobacteria bacterium]|nr:MAG: hypothetical protein D6678_00470 [Zetaproteobacteria bacterium]
MTFFDSSRPLQTLFPAMMSMVRNPGAFFEALPFHPYYRHGVFLASFAVLLFSFLAVPFHGVLTLFIFPISWAAVLLFVWLWSRYLSWAMRTIPRLPMPRLLAFNITSYCVIPLALLAIPYVGWIGLLASVYLQWQALVHRGKVNSATALMMSIVPAAVVLFIGVAGWIAAMSVQVHLVD